MENKKKMKQLHAVLLIRGIVLWNILSEILYNHTLPNSFLLKTEYPKERMCRRFLKNANLSGINREYTLCLSHHQEMSYND